MLYITTRDMTIQYSLTKSTDFLIIGRKPWSCVHNVYRLVILTQL